ncbi:MAG: hypothetical protein QG626_219 [Patescibacteria group bacterium]|jgi:hypothetical protein|nr:hypothetical protein [Patescibacteria group bacterium]
MTTTTHTAIGTLVGTAVGNPLLGFILGLSSHYLVDMIPHGDMFMREPDNLVNKITEKLAHVFVITDIALGLTLLTVLGYFLPNEITRSPVYIASIFGSILPDLMVGINDLVKTALGRKHTQVHFFFHDFFCRKHGDPKLRYALAAQALFVLGVIYYFSI